MQDYIIHTSSRFPTFTVSNLLNTALSHGVSIKTAEDSLKIGVTPNSAFLNFKFATDEDAKLVASKSIVVKSISKHIFTASNWEEILEFANKYEHSYNNGSFAIRIETYNKKLQQDQQMPYINQLISALKLNSKVDIKNPDTKIMIFMDFEDSTSEKPHRIQLSTYLGEGNFEFPDKFTLKKRSFINKTSMESTLALHSAVHGLAGPGRLIYDPFCGSCSILVAAASLGSLVVGSDLDMKAMTEQGYKEEKDISIRANFVQYGLESRLIGVARANFLEDRLIPKNLDAIVTDPPYGIREKIVAESGLSPLHPLLLHLYEFASKHLKIGGRLVYWLPCGYDLNVERDLPKISTMKVVSNCQQYLNSRYCRHLITLEKTNEDENAKVVFENYEASWLKVHDIVFKPNEEKDRHVRKKMLKAQGKRKENLNLQGTA